MGTCERPGRCQAVPAQKINLLRPMAMETRCSKVVFPNYSKKKPAEDNARAAAMGNTSKKMFVFLALFVDAAVRGGTCAFTLKIDTSYQKYSTR